MKVHISCALTHVPRTAFEGYVLFVHDLASALRRGGCERVTYPLINSDPQLAEKPYDERARLCYLWDRELVEQADVLVADVTYPAIGLGIELQVAESKDVPIILCFNKSAHNRAVPVSYTNPDSKRHSLQIGEGYVSLMALGLPSIYKVIGYETVEDGLAGVVESVHLIERR